MTYLGDSFFINSKYEKYHIKYVETYVKQGLH